MAKNNELDMLNGALLPKILMFSLPLALTGILQLLFNAADVIVVGKFAGSTSLAAVGATSALVNLLTGAFIGISVGVNILVARYAGCRDDARVGRAVHSAIALSLVLGVVTFLLGFFLSTPMLEWMDTPDDVLALASLYLRIYFIGIPGALIYNFAAAILRAYGDTKRPLIFLAISGVLNVFLNLFFVIVCELDVAGVAIATVVSQYVAVVLILICLVRQEGPAKLKLREIRLHPDEALRMIQIGLPAGLQSVVFNKAAMAVDTHVFRVSHRIGLVPDSCTTPFSVEKELVKNIPEKLIPIAHHWLILHGRYVCQARTPKCDTCGLQMMCKYFCNTYKVTKEEPKAKNK